MSTSTRHIFFIDARVADYSSLIDGLPAESEWFVLDAEQDGITQMQTMLADYSGLDSIQIISHGAPATLYLGSTVLDGGNLGSYQSQLASIGSALTETGDILLYGCNVAQGDVGVRFVGNLAQATGADVAASSDATGPKELGGDWALEQGIGSVEASAPPINDLTGMLAVNTTPTFTMRDGKVTTDFGFSDYGSDLMIQEDGKILVAGGSTQEGVSSFALARYNIDGTLDTGFSSDGIVVTNFGSQNSGTSVMAQTDGKILLSGSIGSSSGIARYNIDGSLDTTFDHDGLLLTNVGYYGITLRLQADGKILTSGSRGNAITLERYNADGSPDTSFGNGGHIDTNFNQFQVWCSSITIQEDGKIVAVGSAGGNFLLLRYNSNGSLDTSFGGDGIVIANVGTNGWVSSVSVQADGKIIAAGNSGANFTLARFQVDGSLDTSFGAGGIAKAFDGIASARSVILQEDGKILLVGGNSQALALARYTLDGNLDASFDGDGLVTPFFSHATIDFSSVKLQADGKIVVAGTSNEDFALARFNPDVSLDNTFSMPASTLTESPTYFEAWDSNYYIVLDRGIQVFDGELAVADNYSGATLSLSRHTGASAQDVFTAKASGTLTVLTQNSYFAVDGVTVGRVTTNSAGTLTLTFNANATQSMVNKAMQQIAYANTSDAPPASVQIDWTFNDGNTGTQGTGGAMSVMGSTSVTITPVNDYPYLSSQIPDQSALIGNTYTYAIPAGAFVDPDGETLTYTARMADGTGMPPWLTFNRTTKSFSGTPTAGDTGTLSIQLTATDGSGASTLDVFNLNVAVNIPPTLVITALPEPTGRNGMTVSIDNFTVTNLGNGYTNYQATYTEKNLTNISIDQATLRLYFSDGEPAPHYGFFGTVLPGEAYATTQSYDFVVSSSLHPTYLEYDTDHFFSSSPIVNSLKWVVNNDQLILDSDPPTGTISYSDTVLDDQFSNAEGKLIGSDENTGTTLTYGISGGSSTSTAVTKAGTYGTLTVTKATGAYIFSPNDAAIETRKTNINEIFTVTVSDGTATTNATYTVNLTGANDPTTFGGTTAGMVTENGTTVASGTLTASDRDTGDALISAQSNTAGTYGTFNIGSNGAWSYTLNNSAANVQALKAGQSVTDSFNVASAGGATQTVSITVNGANDVPTLSTPTAIAYADTSANDIYVLEHNGSLVASDIDGNTLTFGISGGTASDAGHVSKTGSFGSLMVNTTTGGYTFFPNNTAIQVRKTNSTETFTVTASDGTATTNATLTVNIAGTNDTPEANDSTGNTSENIAMTGSLSASDRDNDPLTFSKASNPNHGSVTVNANGSYTYTPANDYFGTDSFTFTARDGALSDTGTVSLTIGDVDTQPITGDDSYSVNEDVTLTVPASGVLGNDSLGGDGGTLAPTLVTNVQHGSLTLNANGSFTYAPTANYHGTDSFTYSIQDADGDTNTATVSLNITSVNDAPTLAKAIADQTANNGTSFSLTVPSNTFTDADGDTLTYSATLNSGNPLPTWLSFNTSTHSFSGTPSITDIGTLDIRVQASDVSASTSDTFQLTIGDIPNPITGRSGNDTLTGSLGNDSLNGLEGTDTAIYTARMAAYTISPTAISGPDGTDTLASIERLQFLDANLAFDLDGNAGQTYRLYQASFNRTPDLAGLGGWIAAMDNGTTPTQVATSFMASAEFQSLYGANPSNEQFVSLLYTNALHRSADAGGLAYWVNQLSSNLQTRAQALLSLAESAENKASVLPAISNGIVYANATQAAGPANGQSFTGTTGDDSLIGSVGNDTLSSGAGNDNINAGFGNDRITAGTGNDTINGGGGLDLAIYSGQRASYSVTNSNGTLTVSGGSDGTDTLTNVERLQFSDGGLAFDTNGNAGQVYRLYQAAFDRTPDTAGLSGWMRGMDNGLTLQNVATGFIGSDEFKGLYGANPTDAAFVDLLYQNVLNRDPDDGGKGYWLDTLDNGMTREMALIGFSESPENQAAVIGVIQDGIAFIPG